jgi:hypothetical protein
MREKAMAESSDVLWKWAQSPQAKEGLDAQSAKQARAALGSAQAQERLWRAALEHAQTQSAKNASFGRQEPDPWAPARALMAVGLDASRMGGKDGDGPLLWAVRHGHWLLAEGALAWAPAQEANRSNADKKTALSLAAERLASGSVCGDKALAGARFVARLAGGGRVEAKREDQLALAFFALQGAPLHWAQPQPRQPGAEPMECLAAMGEIAKAFVAAGGDLNAARLGRGVSIGSPICTPLAYLVKRLHQWDKVAGVFAHPKLKGLAEGLIEQMLQMGADPGLQMESVERNALMDICRGGRLSERVASALERAILGQALGLGAQSASETDETSAAPKKASRRL